MREIRLALHLTQQEMAVRCGLARQSWQALERGLVLVSPEVEEKLGLGPLPVTASRSASS
ncbi:helix-turn-helix transcriptional regulator [bacterium]|nr:helix-turn-helix transcriptional regulator [bacterium]